MYREPFASLGEVAAYLKTTSMYCVARDGEYLHFTPLPLRDFASRRRMTGVAERADGSHRVAFAPRPDDVRFLRPFKFEDLTFRGTLEFRSVCQQPVDEAMTVAAFHAGLAERLGELEEMLAADTSLYGHGYEPWELRRMLCRSPRPPFADAAALSARLVALVALAEAGLNDRGYGEARFLAPLYRRAETLTPPAARSGAGSAPVSAVQSYVAKTT